MCLIIFNDILWNHAKVCEYLIYVTFCNDVLCKTLFYRSLVITFSCIIYMSILWDLVNPKIDESIYNFIQGRKLCLRQCLSNNVDLVRKNFSNSSLMCVRNSVFLLKVIVYFCKVCIIILKTT